jgi:hypothetical protein
MKFRSLILFLLVLLSLYVAGCSPNPGNGNSANNSNIADAASERSAGTPIAAGGEMASASPDELVADLYKHHDGQTGPFFQNISRARIDKYFTKTLGDMIWKDAVSSDGEVGAIDADPLYNAQDTEIKSLAIGSAELKGNTATVPVTFTNFGKRTTISFLLKQVNGSWKIDNIRYEGGESLVKWLNDVYSTVDDQQAASGEFEGKFQVGETTCTVKPVKMAFEVRWAKGSGVEIFYYRSGNTFESSPESGEPNRFEFDDENYATGIFYRGDGREFPVKRAK